MITVFIIPAGNVIGLALLKPDRNAVTTVDRGGPVLIQYVVLPVMGAVFADMSLFVFHFSPSFLIDAALS